MFRTVLTVFYVTPRKGALCSHIFAAVMNREKPLFKEVFNFEIYFEKNENRDDHGGDDPKEAE